MNIYDNRPYVVCHVLSSLDGRISGSFFGASETMEAMPVFGGIRRDYNCQAVLNGTVTCAQIYADGYIRKIPKSEKSFERKDYAAATDLRNFVVCVDTEGTLRWNGNTISRDGQRNHVIEILGEDVSDDYIAYLRSMDISYIFAGRDALDVPLAMEKLKKIFHIDSLMITGGGIIDWSFLEAGMIDEVSLVVAPVVSGERETATTFDQSDYTSGGPVSMALEDVKRYDGGVLWLDYKKK